MSDLAAQLIARLLAARTAAHLAHFKTRSYAQHMALESFYEDIVDLADRFSEAYQGLFEQIETYPDVPVPTQDPLMFLVDLADWLKANRTKACAGETALENIVDEAIATTAQALYRLRFLK